MSRSPSVLDVIDNFLLLRPDKEILTLPGTALYDLGSEVRAFTDAYTVPPPKPGERRIYLGGWPSASFWAVHGELLLSSLLYTGQVLIKDPLADWFGEEQYRNQHLMAARPGYRQEDGTPNAAYTRWFLAHVLPALEYLRPLIEADLVAFVPGEKYILHEQAAVADLERALTPAGPPGPAGVRASVQAH